jgi:hypothetical protein
MFLIDPPDPEEADEPDPEFVGPPREDLSVPEPPHPINWDLLGPDEAEKEWNVLNSWVNWLRHDYGLPVTIIPPFWHRHRELVWELSALHLHRLCAYDPEQDGSVPIRWHADFAAARQRLRDWVAIAGTTLNSDRPTRLTVWPGETPAALQEERTIENRDEDFRQFVKDDVAARRKAEQAFYAGSEPRRTTGRRRS